MSEYPRIRTVGMSGILVTFADAMSEPANRAALAFKAAIAENQWEHVTEVSSSLVSTFLQADLAVAPVAQITTRLATLLAEKDWMQEPLPRGRKLWHIPTLYDEDRAPQLAEAAELAGISTQQAIAELSAARVRVLTIGYAPGQPYLGEMEPHWNIPRMQGIAPSVPPGALVAAIRQLIIFTAASPTGWRHVGQTAFRNFIPEAAEPFALTPGDELQFSAVSPGEFHRIESHSDSNGGSVWEPIP